MRVFLSAAVFVLMCCTAMAQGQSNPGTFAVKGTAIDSLTREPVGYATVKITNGESRITGAVITREDGTFTAPIKEAGEYTVELSFTGYTTAVREFSVNDENPTAELGTVRMLAGLLTDEVRVTAQLPLVTTDIDKISYNPEADPETPALTAIEMMRKVPLLTVDGEDNIQLKGQSNYKILVNGKTSTLMSKNYKEVLKAWPASQIKRIEVITDPPSKYDAEGIGGIINIVTVRKTNNGYNGSIGLRGGLTKNQPTFGANGYMAASIGKFSISGNYSYFQHRAPAARYESYQENYASEEFRTTIGASRGASSKNHGHNGGLEASYEIDTLNLLTLAFNGYGGNWDSKSLMGTDVYDVNGIRTRGFENVGRYKGNWGGISGNLDYQRSFQKPDRLFTVSYKMDYSPGRNESRNLIENAFNYDAYGTFNKTKTDDWEHTVQADYFDPITEHHQLETGLKYILRPKSTDNDYQEFIDGVWMRTPENIQQLDYKEHIAAFYAAYLYKLKSFSLKAGTRMEYTINDGTVKGDDERYTIDNKYFDFIPYLTLNYKISDQQSVRLGYTQRLQRPGLWHLNPYVNISPLSVRYGNPHLSSVVSHSINSNYSLFKPTFNFNVSLSASFSNNTIQDVSWIDAQGITTTTYDNVGKNERYSLYLYGSKRFLNNKLTVSLNGGVNYVKVSANNDTGLKNSGWEGNAWANIQAQPWKNGNIYVNGGFGRWGVNLQSNPSTWHHHSVGVSQHLLDRKLRVGFNVSQPFRKYNTFNQETFGSDYYSRSKGRYYARSFSVNASWNFGKMQTQVKKARRSIENDDRMSGGGSQGGAQGGGGGQ